MIATRVNKNKIRFHLDIPGDMFLAYYEGTVKDVVVLSDDNRTIKFPASAIRNFITRDGISGIFEILFDENNKLIKVERINH